MSSFQSLGLPWFAFWCRHFDLVWFGVFACFGSPKAFNRISLHKRGCPGIHYIDQTDLGLKDPAVSSFLHLSVGIRRMIKKSKERMLNRHFGHGLCDLPQGGRPA